MTAARLPLAKDLAEFVFAGTPINERLVKELASGAFIASQRNAVVVGGTGTGKTHLAIAIARACIRGGARGRLFASRTFGSRPATWSTASRARADMATRAAPPTTSPAWTPWCSTSWATCPSPSPAGNCSST